MANADILTGKKILIVDDEPDIIESIEEVLDMCDLESASSYEDAKQLLMFKTYDVAVLDIMGVNGYGLLSIASGKGIPAVMLTAHALTADNFVKSMDGGACAYLPKDTIAEIDTFIAEIIEDDRKECGLFGRWFDRLKGYYENKFGEGWLDEYKGAWH